MPTQPFDQARECGKGASDDYCGEFGERPHADCFRGPGFVNRFSQVHAVDQTYDARNARTTRHVSVRFCRGNIGTHRSPIPNTAEMINFLLNAILSFQTANTGSKSIEKSLATLIADVAKMDA